MWRGRPRRRSLARQRGAALLLAIFYLVLVSAVALAMLFSADTETQISVNYRDKQAAIYGALSGLEEARDRIHPTEGDLACNFQGATDTGMCWVPSAMPTSANASVLYIINPGPGQTVSDIAPWSPTVDGKPNPYFDSEICNEDYFKNLTGFCTGTPAHPAGTSWYKYYDNSLVPSAQTIAALGTVNSVLQARQATWQQTNPVTYRWVRITLKADNMTPVPVVSSPTGQQVCWDTHHEQLITSGFGADCLPGNGSISITVTNPGSGYTSVPNVTIGAPGGVGTQAAATAVLQANGTGSVASINLSDYGHGYTSPPAVTITGDGTGATATAQLATTGPVESVTINTSGTPPCYASGAVLTPYFDTAYGSGASGTVQLEGTPRCIYNFSAGGKCSAKNVTSTVTAANGGGSGFEGTITAGTNKSASGSMGSPGTGYTSVPNTWSETNPACSDVTITPQMGYHVQGVTITNGGSYSNPPSVSLAGAVPATGSGSISGVGNLSVGVGSGALQGATVAAGGSGYTYANVTIADPPPGPGNRTAVGSATLAGASNGVQIPTGNVNGGSGYTSAPSVTIDPPCTPFPSCGGTLATAVANLVGTPGGQTGPVYLLTSFAQTPNGARAMAQMEVAIVYGQFHLGLGGALTLVGYNNPFGTFGTPNSNPFHMVGTDANSCGETAKPPKDAIGIDDPNDPNAVSTILDALGKPNNYIGANSAPDVQNANLNTTASGLNAFSNDVAAVACSQGSYYCNLYSAGSPVSCTPGCVNQTPPTCNSLCSSCQNQCPTFKQVSQLSLGTASNPPTNYVNGNYTMGPSQGYGILFVTQQLSFSGNYAWDGLILVIGEGASVMSGGGNGQVNGAVYVANTSGGQVSVNWDGGGGNGIYYDHCWADNLLAKIPMSATPSPNTLSVISLRTLVY